MPKRRNPFDDSPFLMKMHIRQKEVDLGVNHEENMKKVYENTLKMLFNGSMKNQTKSLNVQNESSIYKNADPSILNGTSAGQNGMSVVCDDLSVFQNKRPSYNELPVYQNGTLAIKNEISAYQNGTLGYQNETSAYQNGTSAIHNGTSVFHNGLSTFSNAASSILNRSMNGQKYFQQKIGGIKSGKVDTGNPCCKSNSQIHCSFCERIMCAICSRICDNCSFKFCHLCSILKYDSQEETAVCLSCM